MSQARAVEAETSGLDALALQQRMELQYEIEQFLYAEAAMLDGREYRAWLDLWTEDCSYWMPIRRTVTLSDIDREFTKRGDMSFYDDDKQALAMRVAKMESGSSWSEDHATPHAPYRRQCPVSTGRERRGDEQTTSTLPSSSTAAVSIRSESMWVGRRVDSASPRRCRAPSSADRRKFISTRR